MLHGYSWLEPAEMISGKLGVTFLVSTPYEQWSPLFRDTVSTQD